MTDQANSLRRKMKTPHPTRGARTIAFISGKGGVGKSNISLNFSLELIRRNKKVVLFDLDVGMGNINILLGLQPKNTIVDLFNEQLSIIETIEKGPEGLAYIAGGTGLSRFLEMKQADKDFFYEQFELLTEMYDYIIFDMGAGITETSLFFILAADECMVVTTGEPTAITDAYSMIKQITSNGGTMPIHLILNRARSQGESTTLKQLQKVIRQFLQIEVYPLGLIPEDKHVVQAVIRQIPYSIFNEKAPAARSIKQITESYLHNETDITLTDKPAFLKKIKNLLRGKL
ncbi:MinD/ParA family protein [Oceanobacillus alkalisoli]|uniref:MinD/ParA family protein n=1 Tax=Oceanobacillus alkalisoli TaxID=2925113 RepID=UPI001EF0034A|nr:MinD/ParA family protein [Oceanobacillus alkalisoli]MCF3942414.1 MinD/ParA family protein [Oceanobacillus alkalisoli]MCG5103471.1 MinD/ParA family protein [Oceanobacillus alkalisoli]